MTAEISAVSFAELKDWAEQSFQQLADNKKLVFEVQRDEGLPAAIHTDVRRLQQVLKNLLSNAFKFTNEGGITLRMSVAKEGWSADHPVLSREGSVIAFTVADTGIGIPEDKQKIVFEAFQQADGTTSRKYGGTGLGLSISREIARLLCGELRLKSTPGKGSEFTLYLPETLAPSDIAPAAEEYVPELELAPATPAPGVAQAGVHPDAALLLRSDVADDRESIQPGDRILLIVEDDTRFAPLLLNIAREKGFKGLVATRGDIALALAEKYKPDAITLDIRLPDMHGLAVLDRLKHQASTRHIPVHIISVDEVRQRGLKMGAFAYLQKPVTEEKLNEALAGIKVYVEREVRRLLVVEDDEVHRNSTAELLAGRDVVTTAVGTGAEALSALKGDRYDCLVLDLGLPDMSGLELMNEIKKQEKLADLPIIIYTGRELTAEQETEIKRLTETIIVKDVRSPERLLDETALFLHRVEANLPQDKKRMIQEVHQKDSVISGKRILIVDDDVRNVFALTSLLEHHGVRVFYATNGKEGLRVLQETPDIDVVLMDIMMPEMDGYEATQAIRNIPRFKSLPIIALTAKAMKGDREKCIEAGTSDYIAKPVEAEQLLSLLRVWLYK